MDIHTIVSLARAATTTFSEAQTLIEAYANVIAGAAVHKALEEAHARTMSILGASTEMPLAPMTRQQAEDMTRRSV